MKLFFPAKGGFLLWQGHSETSAFWLFWCPRRLQTNLLDSHQGLCLAWCPWRSFIIIWFNYVRDYCRINSSCDLINLLRFFVGKFLLPKSLCVMTSRLGFYVIELAGFESFQLEVTRDPRRFLSSFVCFNLKYDYSWLGSIQAIYITLWDSVRYFRNRQIQFARFDLFSIFPTSTEDFLAHFSTCQVSEVSTKFFLFLTELTSVTLLI